jgi:hypothetical protein
MRIHSFTFSPSDIGRSSISPPKPLRIRLTRESSFKLMEVEELKKRLSGDIEMSEEKREDLYELEDQRVEQKQQQNETALQDTVNLCEHFFGDSESSMKHDSPMSAASSDTEDDSVDSKNRTRVERQIVAEAWNIALKQQQSGTSNFLADLVSPSSLAFRKSPTRLTLSRTSNVSVCSQDSINSMTKITLSRSKSDSSAGKDMWLHPSLLQAQLTFRQPYPMLSSISEASCSSNSNSHARFQRNSRSPRLKESKSQSFSLNQSNSKRTSSLRATRLALKLKVSCSRDSITRDGAEKDDSADSHSRSSRPSRRDSSKLDRLNKSTRRGMRRSRSSSPNRKQG